ncbi:MAG: hypothetical protein LWW94_08510 [Candidatus Desulfofervidaceae bacterium]|nr:hypothetical protein [Candidatus Desulfofervidaceae bacterium]
MKAQYIRTVTGSYFYSSVLPGILLTYSDSGSFFYSTFEAGNKKNDIKQALYEFARMLVDVPKVVALTYFEENKKDKHVIVWTFIIERNKEIMNQIYERELKLMQKFPNILFDFNISFVRNREKQLFIPDDLHGYLVFYQDVEHGNRSGTSEKSRT